MQDTLPLMIIIHFPIQSVMFDSSLKYMAKLLLPPFLRTTKIMAWTEILTSSIESLRMQFAIYRINSLFLLSHNCQVIYLEHLLNEYFNPSGTSDDPNYQNGIYISDATPGTDTYFYNNFEQGDQVFLFNKAEDQPATFLFNSEEFADRMGFIVNVPSSFNANIEEMKGLLNKLKLAGKTYKINII